MCRTERRRTLYESCDFRSRGITQSLLSIPLNQETSGRKGRRIRLAGERESERESGFSNPDGVFRGTTITVEKHAVCIRESGSGGVDAARFASQNPSHLHERGSSKLGD